MENKGIHFNINEVKNEEKNIIDVSLNDLNNRQCINSRMYTRMNESIHYHTPFAINGNNLNIVTDLNKYVNDKLDNNIAKTKVKQIIKTARTKNKLELIDKKNKENLKKYYGEYYGLQNQNIVERREQPIIQQDIRGEVQNEILNNGLIEQVNSIINNISNSLKQSTDINLILSEIRLEHEKNNLFQNKKKLILLNFEDDTFRPVLEIEEKYMNIIKSWYETNNLLLDIEETDKFIPENITKTELQDYLFRNISCEYKEDYLDIYIPQVINYLLSKKSLSSLGKKYFNNNENILIKNDETIDVSLNNMLVDLGIEIPENMIYKEDYFYSKNQNKKSIQVREFFDTVSYNESGIIKYNKDDDTNKMYPAYNSDYNSLYPKFGDNFELIEEINKKVLDDSPQKSLTVILFNPFYLQTIVIEEPDEDTLYTIRNYNEYGFIQLFALCTNKNNIDLQTFIKNEYHQLIFNDIEELNNTLNTTSQFIDFNKKHLNKAINILDEEIQVKNYFNLNYTFTDHIEDKIKASELYDLVINSASIIIDKEKLSGFRNRLSKYLTELGLKKKRYNDGYYYYGLVSKIYHIQELDLDQVYDKLLKERAKIDNEYFGTQNRQMNINKINNKLT